MKRLRHPIRAIREPFGTAGLVVACVALIAALGGTALAAAKLNSTQKKEVEKIAKKYAGAPGAPGAAGPAGPAGPQGPAGAKGDAGAQGPTGTNGANGKSVAVSNTAPGCTEGGVSVEVEGAPASKKEVCNGEEGAEGTPGTTGATGPQGLEGSPWTFSSLLPAGAIETGTWTLDVSKADAPEEHNMALASISFPVSLPFNLKAAHVHFETEENFSDFDGEGAGTAGCKAGLKNPAGTAAAETLNPPGELCVYMAIIGLQGSTFEGIYQLEAVTKGTARAGASLQFDVPKETAINLIGSFAVTGCTKEVGKPFECPAGS
jgi:hypothetical protein